MEVVVEEVGLSEKREGGREVRVRLKDSCVGGKGEEEGEAPGESVGVGLAVGVTVGVGVLEAVGGMVAMALPVASSVAWGEMERVVVGGVDMVLPPCP